MADDHPVAATEHRQLSKEESEEFVRAAFDAEREIKQKMGRAHVAWWDLAHSLYEFHEAGYWSVLGYGSLDEFLAQPDLGMARSQFFQMSKTWRDLVVVKKLPPADLEELEPSKVREVVPAIMKGEVAPQDALDDAAGLSYRDVKAKYRPEEQAKHGQAADDTTPLDALDEPQAVKCFNCGSWYTPPPPIEGTATEIEEAEDADEH